MSEREKVASSSSIQSKKILVPLYIYPSPGAWDPLFKAIQKFNSITFIIIINPSNGPGGHGYEGVNNDILLPDTNYTREIPKLNLYANVKTVGYISTNWARRKLHLAINDVAIYSIWSKYPGLGVNGIFLDETLTHYDDSGAFYLRELASFILSEKNFGQDALIIHNPGAIPDVRYMSYCNIAVVFEDSYSKFHQRYGDDFLKTLVAFQKAANIGRDAIACIIHSLSSPQSPSKLSSSNERMSLIQDLCTFSQTIFVTGLFVDYYTRFWDEWHLFVADVAAVVKIH